MNIFNKFKRISYPLFDHSTNRKIVVIESDDWGTIRMPSKKVFNSIPEKFKKHFNSPYYLYDTIARKKDFEGIFEVFNSIKDKNGNPPVLTANVIMANPDFDKIEKDSYEKYSYEIFTETLKRYYSQNPFNSWLEGIENGFFYPQLHGREHVHVLKWLEYLKAGNSLYLEAFKRSIFSVDHDLSEFKKNLTASFDIFSEDDKEFHQNSIEEACKIFEQVFGFKAKSFIAPSYTWYPLIEQSLSTEKVKYIQGIRSQKIPDKKKGYLYQIHYSGEKNKRGQIYLIRNAFFEPSLFTDSDAVHQCLKRIQLAFRMKKPVIISMHRLNVVGALNERNRSINLKLLRSLLKNIVSIWPKVEFMTSNELGNLIENNI